MCYTLCRRCHQNLTEGEGERQENRSAVCCGVEPQKAGSVFIEQGVYESYSTLNLWSKCPRVCGFTPGKVTGQQVTVKAEMNEFTKQTTNRPTEWGQGGQSSSALRFLILSVQFPKLNNQNKFFD